MNSASASSRMRDLSCVHASSLNNLLDQVGRGAAGLIEKHQTTEHNWTLSDAGSGFELVYWHIGIKRVSIVFHWIRLPFRRVENCLLNGPNRFERVRMGFDACSRSAIFLESIYDLSAKCIAFGLACIYSTTSSNEQLLWARILIIPRGTRSHSHT